jgi:hypothetical protein
MKEELSGLKAQLSAMETRRDTMEVELAELQGSKKALKELQDKFNDYKKSTKDRLNVYAEVARRAQEPPVDVGTDPAPGAERCDEPHATKVFHEEMSRHLHDLIVRIDAEGVHRLKGLSNEAFATEVVEPLDKYYAAVRERLREIPEEERRAVGMLSTFTHMKWAQLLGQISERCPLLDWRASDGHRQRKDYANIMVGTDGEACFGCGVMLQPLFEPRHPVQGQRLVNSKECPSMAQDCPTCKEIRVALKWRNGNIKHGEKVCPFGDNFANLNKFVKWLKLKKVWVPPKEEKSSTFASGPLPFLPKAGSSAKKRKRG